MADHAPHPLESKMPLPNTQREEILRERKGLMAVLVGEKGGINSKHNIKNGCLIYYSVLDYTCVSH